jgi:hypothetical protein
MPKMDFDAVFGSVKLAVRPAMAADGASLALIEEPVAPESLGQMPFFGGYAEDMLADIGFDVVEDAPRATRTRLA